jgi:hypothetical protein
VPIDRSREKIDAAYAMIPGGRTRIQSKAGRGLRVLADGRGVLIAKSRSNRDHLEKVIYIKSLFLGIVAFVASAILYITILFVTMMRRYRPPPGTEIGLDLRAVVLSPSFWLVTLLAFALAFYWEFRRAA